MQWHTCPEVDYQANNSKPTNYPNHTDDSYNANYPHKSSDPDHSNYPNGFGFSL